MRWIMPAAAIVILIGAGLEAQPRSGSAGVWKLLAARYDRNGDGKIAREEYPREPAKFGAYDRDGDGVITRRDFDGGARRRPTRPRRANSGDKIAAYLAAAADTDGDGRVTTSERKAFAAAVRTADGERVDPAKLKQAVTPDLGGARARMRMRMVSRTLDHDRDGVIRVADIERLLAGLDRDGNGVIEKAELPSRRRSARPPESQLPRRGDPAPDFNLPYPGDRKGTVRLSSFQGKKPVALIFGSYT